MKGHALLVLLLTVAGVSVSGCESKEKIAKQEEDRQEMIREFRATADCLEAGQPIVNCRQRAAKGCEMLNK